MKPRLEILSEKKLVGTRLSMTLSDDKTPALWQSFMPRRKEIENRVGTDLFSMQVYNQSFDFEKFDQGTSFEKWAAVEVTDFDNIPVGMEAYQLPAGLHAVFLYKGTPDTFYKAAQYIFGTWLPNSEYLLDNRPHFEVLGERYKNNHPDSEEEIWIPIKAKE